MAALNFLQLVNRVRQNCGMSGSDYTSLATLPADGQRLKNWVNESWMEIQAMHQDWEWQRKSIAFPTVAGQPFYTLSQIGNASDFGMWAQDTFRNYANPTVTISIASPAVVTFANHALSVGDSIQFFTTGSLPNGLALGVNYYVFSIVDANNFTVSALATGGVPVVTTGSQSGIQTITSSNTTTFAGFKSELYMEYDEYDAWRNSYEYGALRAIRTRPLNVTITPQKYLGLGPFPDAGYTVVGDYYVTPYELVADTDVPTLPAKFQYAIIYGAMIAYGNYEAAPEVLSRANPEFDKWMRRIMIDQLREVGSAGTLC